MRRTLSTFLSRQERAALEAIRHSGRDFTDTSALPYGVGQVTLDRLLQRGLIEAGPSKPGKKGRSYRISDDGWICMFGAPFERIGAGKTPLFFWTWPSSR